MDLEKLRSKIKMPSLTRNEVIEYYKFLREEIAREDGITASRMTSMLTFQGFLVSAVGLLMTNGWQVAPSSPQELAAGLACLRQNLLILLGLVGAFMAFFSALGILASSRALDVAKLEWELVLKNHQAQEGENDDSRILEDDLFKSGKSGETIYRLGIFPRAYGPRTDSGGRYATYLPFAFLTIWVIYLTLCFMTLPIFGAWKQTLEMHVSC